MKKNNFSRLFAAMIFVAVLVLSGCGKTPAKASIYGDWVDSSKAHYEITKSTFKNYGENYDSYAGDNLTVDEISDTEGTIFIKYTIAANADWTYSATAPDVGKWYAISYKDLTENAVKISGAYKAGGKTACATLEEAKTEFTAANGYFDYYSECTKAE